jgi:hypothetical protein
MMDEQEIGPLFDSPRTYECHITIGLASGGSITIDATDLTREGLTELWGILTPAFAQAPEPGAPDAE